MQYHEAEFVGDLRLGRKRGSIPRETLLRSRGLNERVSRARDAVAHKIRQLM